MTRDEFRSRLATLLAAAREGGLSDEVVLDEIDMTAELLRDDVAEAAA